MNPPETVRIAIGAVALGLSAGCASPWPLEREAPRAAPVQAAMPAVSEREIRYYRDEQGMVWDDRGRKLDRLDAPPSRP